MSTILRMQVLEIRKWGKPQFLLLISKPQDKFIAVMAVVAFHFTKPFFSRYSYVWK